MSLVLGKLKSRRTTEIRGIGRQVGSVFYPMYLPLSSIHSVNIELGTKHL